MKNNIETLHLWKRKVSSFYNAAHLVLSKVEDSKSRVVLLEKTAKKLAGLPIDIENYFNEAIQCLENDLRRPAIVSSWAGFFHILSEKTFNLKEIELRDKRVKWTFGDLSELKENYTESQILDVIKEVGIIKKAELRIYQGQLSKRNQCAHPTLYNPSRNSAIGFVDDMITQTIKYL
jgi:hypothetical protein